MLNRRQLRIKVLQALYAFFQSGNHDIRNGEQQLFKSIYALNDLFIYQLSFIIELQRFAQTRMEENKLKHFPTLDDLHPNLKFINNRVIHQLGNNPALEREEKRLHINWADQQNIVRKYYNLIREKHEFKQYLNHTEESWDNDRKILIKLIEKYFAEFEILQAYYEEKSIYFVDDYHLVSYFLIKYLKNLNESDALAPLPYIITNPEEDEEFIKRLFRKAILHDKEYEGLIGQKTKNWDLERIATVDIILLKMALTELFEFPSIPVKVTLNEYIDISKYFSTPKSRLFVNGILDRLIDEFKSSGKIVKTGRGLIE